MSKKFVTKKKNFALSIFIWILIATLALVVTFNILMRTSIEGLMGDEKLSDNLFTIATNEKKFLNLDLLNPSDLLKFGLGYHIEYDSPSTIPDLTLISAHENSEHPRIYIYSSHDTESYDSALKEAYSIKYNVTTGGYILSDRLKELGVPSYVEKESMVDYLRAHGLNYNYSYYASKYYIEKRLIEYPTIEIILDLHRDALPRSMSITTIDGKPCAKVSFIVAVEYPGYEKNVALAEKVNAALPDGLSRGLSKGNGYGANGYFNQEMKEGALLIEIGGPENTIEEVANTASYIAKGLKSALDEGDR